MAYARRYGLGQAIDIEAAWGVRPSGLAAGIDPMAERALDPGFARWIAYYQGYAANLPPSLTAGALNAAVRDIMGASIEELAQAGIPEAYWGGANFQGWREVYDGAVEWMARNTPLGATAYSLGYLGALKKWGQITFGTTLVTGPAPAPTGSVEVRETAAVAPPPVDYIEDIVTPDDDVMVGGEPPPYYGAPGPSVAPPPLVATVMPVRPDVLAPTEVREVIEAGPPARIEVRPSGLALVALVVGGLWLALGKKVRRNRNK